jgi:exosortase D (VPLPA-CTERM-specific)
MLPVVIYAPLLLLLYFEALSHMVGQWGSKDYNYCYLVPVVVAYMIWEKRQDLKRLPTCVSWSGLLLLVPGLALFWFGELGGEYFTLLLSFWLVVMGLVLLHIGGRRFREIAFPLLMIVTMFPLPSFLHNRLALKLKLISSRIGVEIMQWAGLSAYREGNVIDLGFTRLQVVDACSGLRYLFPIIVLGLLLAWFFRAPFWKRALLVLSTLPLIVFTNALRIASAGLLYEPFGPKVAEGFFHDFSGWLIFMVTLAILLAEMWLLNRIPGRRLTEGPAVRSHSEVVPHPGNRRIEISRRRLALGLAAGLLLLSWGLSRGIDFREKIPAIRPLSQFPLAIGPWRGKPEMMEQRFIDALDLSDYFIIDYRDDKGHWINFYTAYYESQRKGESIHSPASCLTGSGWIFEEAGEQQLAIPDYGPLTVNRAFMMKNGVRQLVYYWFPQRGRNLTNAYQLKIYVFWDALTKQRTDGALVRLITPVETFEEPAAADRRLQQFLSQALPLLERFLPGSTL